MKTKTIFVYTLLLLFAFQTVGLAAKVNIKPRVSTPRSTQSAPKAAPKAPGYKPSTPAKDIKSQAPANSAAQSKTQAAAQQKPNTSSSLMRNFGMIAGGMLMGSLLGSLFADSPLLGSIFTMLLNGLLLAAVFFGIRMLWNKFKSRNKESADKDRHRLS